MIDIFISRLKQKHRTMAFPDGPAPAMPDRFRGRPMIQTDKCPDGCAVCADACPTRAISLKVDPHPSPLPIGEGAGRAARIDLGRCIFCTDCIDACPQNAISYSGDYRLATRGRADLVVGDEALKLAAALDEKARRLFGHSLKLRQVSAGGCNACEADVNVLNTVGWDLGRFGIQFVASPRHADGVLITGPLSRNMKLGLLKTYEAVPKPKLAIAVGACAISGGPFADHEEVCNGADGLLPVDLYVPGCPPHPLTILDGLLRLLGRIDSETAQELETARA